MGKNSYWGKVPDEYRRVSPSDTDGKNTGEHVTSIEKRTKEL